jgi:LmbE family N-acetylglucosaminyl deacetylase
MRFLNFASHRFDARLENKLTVAKAVAEIRPDVAFTLWKDDHHNDHVVASELSRVAVRNAGQMLDGVDYKPPGRLYFYDNGPRHTIGFTPDTFVDVSDTWAEAQDWLGALMALVRNQPYDRTKPDGAMQAKESLARYRGSMCGARYAEALWLGLPRTSDIL